MSSGGDCQPGLGIPATSGGASKQPGNLLACHGYFGSLRQQRQRNTESFDLISMMANHNLIPTMVPEVIRWQEIFKRFEHIKVVHESTHSQSVFVKG